MKLLKEHGHDVVAYRLVKDEPAQITEEIGTSVGDDSVQAIIINGGTGISRRDSTFEAVDSMLEKRLDGFGEVFRYLTYQEIGSPAIMTRATAGIVKEKCCSPRRGLKMPSVSPCRSSSFLNWVTSCENSPSNREAFFSRQARALIELGADMARSSPRFQHPLVLRDLRFGVSLIVRQQVPHGNHSDYLPALGDAQVSDV